MSIEIKIAFFPEKLTKNDLFVDGNLMFGQYTWNDVVALPENLNVTGWLDISFSRIKMLPNGLRVGKNLDAANSLIEDIGENIRIGGDLNVEKTPLASMQLNSGWFQINREIETKGGDVLGDIRLGIDDDDDDDDDEYTYHEHD